jgi:hypothetical protein
MLHIRITHSFYLSLGAECLPVNVVDVWKSSNIQFVQGGHNRGVYLS